MNNQSTIKMRNEKLTHKVAVLLVCALLLSGCESFSGSASSGDYSYVNPSKSLTSIGRVAIVELDNNSSYPQIAADITDALFQELQKKQLFGLTVIRRSDPSWRSLQLDGDFEYNLNDMSAMYKTLKCDGVLVGTITEFRPYPHMIIGLRLKLLDLRDGQLLWGLEQVWDSADKKTERRIKDYFKSQKRSGYDSLYQELAAVSSLEFIKFVSYETAETL
jgi:hypothetical protein